jgi:hypothetical protein
MPRLDYSLRRAGALVTVTSRAFNVTVPNSLAYKRTLRGNTEVAIVRFNHLKGMPTSTVHV